MRVCVCDWGRAPRNYLFISDTSHSYSYLLLLLLFAFAFLWIFIVEKRSTTTTATTTDLFLIPFIGLYISAIEGLFIYVCLSPETTLLSCYI